MLQQANTQISQAGVLFTEEPTSKITPSLAALDDAKALRRRQWRRGEPSEDIPRQYSTMCGNLTPTQLKHEVIRMDLTLNVTPEGSLSDLPAATRGDAGFRKEQGAQEASESEIRGVQPSNTVLDQMEETPHTSVKTVPGRSSNKQRIGQVDPPRRILRTREASQEDALASARQFFASVNGQNQVVTLELPEGVPTVTTGRTTLTPTPAVTSTIPTTSASTTITWAEAGSPRMFLPHGSPSRPTVTATCRPQTWMQRVSEGWTNVPPPDDTYSGEINLPEPSLLEEEVPKDLGNQWRVLYPLELPGVRFSTDTTLPNQRRLADNDALVELIQTTEYLEEMPAWGQ